MQQVSFLLSFPPRYSVVIIIKSKWSYTVVYSKSVFLSFFLLSFYFTSRLWENPSRSKFKNNAVICLSFQMFVKTVTTSSPGTNTHSLLLMNIRQVALSSPNRSRFTLWILLLYGSFSVLSRSTLCSACCVERRRTPSAFYQTTPDSLRRSSRPQKKPVVFRFRVVLASHLGFQPFLSSAQSFVLL